MGAIQQGDGPKLKRPEAQLPRGKIRFSVTALRIWIFLNFNFKLISVLAFFAKRILSFTIFDKRDHSLLFLRMADVNVTISKEKEKKESCRSVYYSPVFNPVLPKKNQKACCLARCQQRAQARTYPWVGSFLVLCQN